MDGQNYLGIYLGKSSATALCLNTHSKEHPVLGAFSVTLENPDADQSPATSLATLIAQGCAQRNLSYSHVAVALDCSMFMQHKVHSEFTDTKQISATVRFDTEEAIAGDISDIALAFKVNSSDETGSDLTVFTAPKDTLADIITALQSNGLDPVSIEPDINCLARFFAKKFITPQSKNPFFAALSSSRGYFAVYADSEKNPLIRTLLLGPSQQRQHLLSGQVPMTLALAQNTNAVDSLKILDSENSVNPQQLTEDLDIETELIDLTTALGSDKTCLDDCENPVDFALAYGAAMQHIEKQHTINFRYDFMPYLGAKKRMERMVRFAGIVASLVMIALGFYFTPQWTQAKYDYEQIVKRAESQYKTINHASISPGENLEKRLTHALNRIEGSKKGSISSGEAIHDRFTLILQAFNECASQTQLEVETISIMKKQASIKGSTSNRQRFLQLKTQLEKVGFEVSPKYKDEAGRTEFNIIVKTRN